MRLLRRLFSDLAEFSTLKSATEVIVMSAGFLRSIFMCFFILCWSVTNAHAAEGSSHGGGGNNLVATFVSTAEVLFAEISFSDSEKKLLNSSLVKSKILSTKV